jgi:hypothetical protein
MPRYFFHYRGPDDELVEDRVGIQLRDVDAVELEAHELALQILEDELDAGGQPSATRCLEIEDEGGEIVLYLPFWASIARKRPSWTSLSSH